MSRLSSPLFLFALWVLFFHDLVLHPGCILYSDYSDLLAEHVPARRFLMRSFQETGELPRWCPYHFAGAPFLHDIQVGAFYPPHALLLLFDESRAGAVLSWLLATHVLLAGLLMLAYAREQGLGPYGSFVAAAGYMFAGKWLLHMLAAGHYILIGLAWLPLVLLCLERAIRHASLTWATAAGVAFALLTLGTQPQWTFYAGIFIALWTLAYPWRTWRAGGVNPLIGTSSIRGFTPPARNELLRWASYGLWTATLGVCLTAIQLLPTAEAASLSTRSLGVDTTEVLQGGIRSFLFIIGPALQAEPPHINLMWEDRGGLTLLWLTAAILGGIWAKGRLRFQAWVTLALVVFAIGGAYFVQGLPGFRFFRQHTRMFVILGFPVALLAGAATDALFDPSPAGAELRRRGRQLLVRLSIGLLILAGGFAARTALEGKALRFEWYWPSLALAVPAAWWLLDQSTRKHGAALWTALLLFDLGALTGPLAATRPEAEIYPKPAWTDLVASHGTHRERVLDRNEQESNTGTPLGTGAPLALLHNIESPRGYSPLDNLRYKQYLQFIAGSDEPLSPLGGPFTSPVISDFPIVNKSLLDLLGVRYLIQSSELPYPGSDWRALQKDDAPAAYDFIAGGVRRLPPCTLYENPTVLPRAFIVYRAERLPEHPDTLATLTFTDFERVVLLEGDVTDTGGALAPARRARVKEYQPNRVVVEVADGVSGWLVLADVWYPGWTATVDGRDVVVQRGDYLFRTVEVPDGACEVVFRFEPESLRLGKRISLTALALVVVLMMGTIVRRGVRRPLVA